MHKLCVKSAPVPVQGYIKTGIYHNIDLVCFLVWLSGRTPAGRQMLASCETLECMSAIKFNMLQSCLFDASASMACMTACEKLAHISNRTYRLAHGSDGTCRVCTSQQLAHQPQACLRHSRKCLFLLQTDCAHELLTWVGSCRSKVGCAELLELLSACQALDGIPAEVAACILSCIACLCGVTTRVQSGILTRHLRSDAGSSDEQVW